MCSPAGLAGQAPPSSSLRAAAIASSDPASASRSPCCSGSVGDGVAMPCVAARDREHRGAGPRAQVELRERAADRGRARAERVIDAVPPKPGSIASTWASGACARAAARAARGSARCRRARGPRSRRSSGASTSTIASAANAHHETTLPGTNGCTAATIGTAIASAIANSNVDDQRAARRRPRSIAAAASGGPAAARDDLGREPARDHDDPAHHADHERRRRRGDREHEQAVDHPAVQPGAEAELAQEARAERRPPRSRSRSPGRHRATSTSSGRRNLRPGRAPRACAAARATTRRS